MSNKRSKSSSSCESPSTSSLEKNDRSEYGLKKKTKPESKDQRTSNKIRNLYQKTIERLQTRVNKLEQMMFVYINRGLYCDAEINLKKIKIQYRIISEQLLKCTQKFDCILVPKNKDLRNYRNANINNVNFKMEFMDKVYEDFEALTAAPNTNNTTTTTTELIKKGEKGEDIIEVQPAHK